MTSSCRSVELLATAMEEGWTTLRQRLEGLSDEEFFWELAPDCWTVHLDEAGRWVEDYADPAPEPTPFTTIAWRIVHVSLCKLMYHEYAFGSAKLTWDELIVPHTAVNAIASLEENHAQLRTALAGLNDNDLLKMRLTNWGEYWPTWRVFWAMAAHDLHHGGEIGCLRDLYRMQHPIQGQPMKAILVFIDGTICDASQRYHLGIGTPEFYRREEMLKDAAVPGSVQCLQKLAQNYELVYIGARPVSTLPVTEKWLAQMGFPQGPVYLGQTQEERLALVRNLRGEFDFVAGIGDRWDDNELHLEMGCLSIILQEHAGDWTSVPRHLERNLP